MKKLIFCVLMTVLCSLPMSAQKRGQRLSPEEMVNKKVEQQENAAYWKEKLIVRYIKKLGISEKGRSQ